MSAGRAGAVNMGSKSPNNCSETESCQEKQGRHCLQVLNLFHGVPASITVRTLSLWTCFFSIAFSDAVRGPTFLDVRDTVGISTQEMSYTYMIGAAGGLIGCLSAGAVLDKFSDSSKYFVLLLCGNLIALLVGTVPYSPGLVFLLGNSLGYGLFSGTFHTCANALFLRVWTGYNSSSAMYALHFFFGVGSLISPLAAKPFLSHTVDVDVMEESELGLAETLLAANTSSLELLLSSNTSSRNSLILQESQVQEYQMTVRTLYPLLGLQMCLLYSPLVFFFLKERKIESEREKDVKTIEGKSPANVDILTATQTIIVMTILFCIYFCFAGLEGSFRNFISTYTVSIGHSRQVGSEITALFYLSFTIVRGLAIVWGNFISPTSTMIASQAVCLVATAILKLWSSSSFLALQIGVALQGAGIANTFATGILWVKDILTLDTRKTAVLTVAMNLSVQTYTFTLGRFIDSSPWTVMDIMLGTASSQIVLFSLLLTLVRQFRKEEEKSAA